MSEQEQSSQLSALFDDELPPQQAQMVVRRAVKDAVMRERWQRYALIGACLRGEPLAGANYPEGVAARVRERLANEADILAPGAALAAARSVGRRGVAGFFGRSAMGGAIAAAVAIVAVFVVRSVGPVGNVGVMVAQGNAPEVVSAPELVGAADPVAARSGSAVAHDSAPPSYTTPGENSRAANPLIDQQPLAHYVVAHSEQAASSPGFSYDLTQGAVDMTEDDIEAHRR